MVPSVDRSHRPLSSQRFRKRIEDSLLEVATGTTTYAGIGRVEERRCASLARANPDR